MLSIAESGELQLNAQTSDGNYFVELPNFPLGQWKKVAVSYQNGTLTLALDDERATVQASGDLQYREVFIDELDSEGNLISSDDFGMVVGQGFDGNLDCLKWFNLFTQPMVTFEDGTSQTEVVIDSNGSAQVTVNSLGRLQSFGSRLSMQTVAAVTPMDSQPISLISTDVFEALTEATVSAGLIEGIPEYSQAYLNDTSTDELDSVGFINTGNQIGLFANAYAYELGWRQILGVVSMLIGLDSLQVIWEQVGNLLMGREVDLVSLSIAILDVLSLFPPAAPLKAVTVPAKLAIKLLRVGNTKAVKYLGGVMKKMVQKAKGRDFSLVFQGIAFMIIIADMAKDEEGREAIKTLASMIGSTDDFFDILEFISLGDDEIDPGESDDTAFLFPSGLQPGSDSVLFPSAYAVVAPNLGRTFTQALKEAIPIISRAKGAGTKSMGEYARTVRKLQRDAVTDIQKRAAARVAKIAFNKDTFKGILAVSGRGGLQKIRNVLTCRYPGQRNSPLLMLGIIGYLESQLFIPSTPSNVEGEEDEPGQDGSLFASLKDDEEEYQKQILELQKVIFGAIPGFCQASKNPKNESALISQAHGKAFQLMQLAILHAAKRDIIGLEVERDVFLFTKTLDLSNQNYDKALIYGRDVDILEKGKNGEVWHEQKSWKGKGQTGKLNFGVTPWKWRSGARQQRADADFDEFDTKLKGSAGHRQFVLDHVGAGLGATKRRATPPSSNENLPIDVEGFEWQFQKFTTGKTANKSKNPSRSNIVNSFSKLPTGITGGLFRGHADRGSMNTDSITIGAIGAILAILEDDFKAAVKEELEAEEIFLNAE